jgi:regulatory protein
MSADETGAGSDGLEPVDSGPVDSAAGWTTGATPPAGERPRPSTRRSASGWVTGLTGPAGEPGSSPTDPLPPSGEEGTTAARGVTGPAGKAWGSSADPLSSGGEEETPYAGGSEPGSGGSAEASGRRRGGRARAGGRKSRRESGEARSGRGEGGPPADPEAEAREICLRLLSFSPRTRAQLADALRRKGVDDEVAERVLSRYTEVGLIDDVAFARAWVQSRHTGRGLARRALAAELRQRGVADDTVKEAVEELDPDQEETAARELVAKRMAATRGLDPVKRTRRILGVLARKGYPSGLAYRLVREALEQEGLDDPGVPTDE